MRLYCSGWFIATAVTILLISFLKIALVLGIGDLCEGAGAKHINNEGKVAGRSGTSSARRELAILKKPYVKILQPPTSVVIAAGSNNVVKFVVKARGRGRPRRMRLIRDLELLVNGRREFRYRKKKGFSSATRTFRLNVAPYRDDDDEVTLKVRARAWPKLRRRERQGYSNIVRILIPPASPPQPKPPACKIVQLDEDETTRVDVMVLYTRRAMCAHAMLSYPCSNTAANRRAIEAEAKINVEITNVAFFHSAIAVTLELIYLGLYGGSDFAAENDPSDTSAEPYQEIVDSLIYDRTDVHELRERYGADLVALIYRQVLRRRQ